MRLEYDQCYLSFVSSTNQQMLLIDNESARLNLIFVLLLTKCSATSDAFAVKKMYGAENYTSVD